MWDLIASTERGFPWLVVAGRVLTGWVVLDLDGGVVFEGAACAIFPTYGINNCPTFRLHQQGRITPTKPGQVTFFVN